MATFRGCHWDRRVRDGVGGITVTLHRAVYQPVLLSPAEHGGGLPAGSPLGYWMVVVPVLGGVLVGLMARFGSDKIRGHGIPEAIEAILLHRAKVDPKIALLKPISAAIAIGSGGPFGLKARSL